MKPVITRLYACNLPQFEGTILKRELTILLQKTVQVHDLYIPGPTLTGLRRDFAIIAILGDESMASNCVKTFNGCYLMGVKIHLEVARTEFYVNRLHKEKESVKQESIESDSPACINNTTVVSLRRGSGYPLQLFSIVPRGNIIDESALSCKRIEFSNNLTVDSTFMAPIKKKRLGFGTLLKSAAHVNDDDMHPAEIEILEDKFAVPDDDDPMLRNELGRSLSVLMSVLNNTTDARLNTTDALVVEKKRLIVPRFDPSKSHRALLESLPNMNPSSRELENMNPSSNELDKFVDLPQLKDIFKKTVRTSRWQLYGFDVLVGWRLVWR